MHRAAQNDSLLSGNENAWTELAAEISRQPISRFAVSCRLRRRRPADRQPREESSVPPCLGVPILKLSDGNRELRVGKWELEVEGDEGATVPSTT